MSKISFVKRCRQLENLLENGAFTRPGGEFVELEAGVGQLRELLLTTATAGNTVFLIGNGGSAAVASHVANDLINSAGIRAATLHDSPSFSCLANDYGYDQVFARSLAVMARPGDLLVAVSSSGRSPNIRNAAAVMLEKGGNLLTVTGFAPDNPLRGMGGWGFWVNSSDYGLVETAHIFMLHHIVDGMPKPK